ERLLDVLDAHGARGTFFTLGLVAQRYPRLVREIAGRGHEVASHGWDHRLVWELGAVVRGYRAPNYSIRPDTPWAFSILAEEGFVYDSSIYPVVHDRYGFPDAPRFAHRGPGGSGLDLWEVPVGTARFARTNLPIGGGFFRLFPLACTRAAVASVNRAERQPAVLYVHPWELDPDQPRPRMSWAQRFRHYTGLRTAERKLRALLAEFRFAAIETVFDQVRPARRAAARAS
ncbi:MAG TPA: DUF3473 domain-containing protein, partial [Solirubrobacter sp.]|nr:DUF3473 domain-containing protein [Solirubrobacter sp.]